MPPRKKKPTINNGLSEAVLGFNPGGIGTQLNQVDTLFINNRWYLISNMRQVLSEIYVEHGLVQTIIDVPVEDGMRGGVDVKSQQLSPDQIEDLKAHADREGFYLTVGQALKWNRLFGGAGIIVITDQKPDEPLNFEAIKENTPIEFRAVDMWELFYDRQNTDGVNVGLSDPLLDFYSYYGVKIHKSRVMKMKGMEPPSFIRPRLRGWGFSVIESLVTSINQFLKSNNLVFEVLDEFKLDVFKFKNLAQTLLSADGTNQVKTRIETANKQKSYNKSLAMDSEDDFIQKQVSFAGLADMYKEFRMQIACAMRMPMSKIFGISASGFNSGEDDIENYNAMVESQIRGKCKYEILRMLEITCKKLFGFVPDDLSIDFAPLRMLSSEQEENVKTQQFNRVLAAATAGLISPEEFKDACNKEELLGIQIESTMELPVDDNTAEEEKKDEGDKKE